MLSHIDIETAEMIARVAEARFASTEEVAALRRVIEAARPMTRTVNLFSKTDVDFCVNELGEGSEAQRGRIEFLLGNDNAQSEPRIASGRFAFLVACARGLGGISESDKLVLDLRDEKLRVAKLSAIVNERALNEEAAAGVFAAIERVLAEDAAFDADDSGAREHVLEREVA